MVHRVVWRGQVYPGQSVDGPFAILSKDLGFSREDRDSNIRRALAGHILHFTGVSDPYEPPLAPDIMIRTDIESEAASADRIWVELVRRGLIQP